MLGYNVGCDISRDGRLVASGSCDGSVHVYDYQLGRPVYRLSLGGLRDSVCVDVAWHPVLPSVMATAMWDGSVAVWQ